MKQISLLLTILSLLFLTQTTVFGQNQDRLPENGPPEITISMKRDGFTCGYVLLDAKSIGACPAYSIIITQDGTVTYDGISSVKVKGKHTFTIPFEQVKQLIAEFEQIKFFDLKDKYTEEQLPNGVVKTVDHSNGTTITLKIGSKTKSVYNFYGAPKELNLLQSKLNDITKNYQR